MRVGEQSCCYYDEGRCRSCHLITLPYTRQLARKAARAADVLDTSWLDPVASEPFGFRNKAKIVVSGSSRDPILGILLDGKPQDLSGCPLYVPALRDAHGPLASYITTAGLEPYDVPNRTGELKSIIVTANPAGRLMVRFVLRSPAHERAIRSTITDLAAQLPIDVATINYLPTHVALPEGDEEVHIFGSPTLDFTLGTITLGLSPGGFFQTNTDIARTLYASAGAWVDELAPHAVWDLYCGAGGFAYSIASPTRSVTGIDLSPGAGPHPAGVDLVAGDVSSWVGSRPAPDLVVVNPPRRGIGALRGWLGSAGPSHLLYSSCKIDSAAADLDACGYRALRAQVFDMFPNTDHFETLILAERIPR